MCIGQWEEELRVTAYESFKKARSYRGLDYNWCGDSGNDGSFPMDRRDVLYSPRNGVPIGSGIIVIRGDKQMTELVYVKVVVSSMRMLETQQIVAEGFIEINARKIPWDAVLNQKMVRFVPERMEFPNMEKDLRDVVLTTLGQVNIPAVKTFTVPKR